MTTTLHHLALTNIDLNAGRRFYDALLGKLGFHAEYAGDELCVWTLPGLDVLMYAAEGPDRSPHTHGRPGWQHAALAVDHRATVDAIPALIAGTGATIVFEPQTYDYMPHYYAVFVEDPSGVRWEILSLEDTAAAPQDANGITDAAE